jgi:hypothetical protein
MSRRTEPHAGRFVFPFQYNNDGRREKHDESRIRRKQLRGSIIG